MNYSKCLPIITLNDSKVIAHNICCKVNNSTNKPNAPPLFFVLFLLIEERLNKSFISICRTYFHLRFIISI